MEKMRMEKNQFILVLLGCMMLSFAEGLLWFKIIYFIVKKNVFFCIKFYKKKIQLRWSPLPWRRFLSTWLQNRRFGSPLLWPPLSKRNICPPRFHKRRSGSPLLCPLVPYHRPSIQEQRPGPSCFHQSRPGPSWPRDLASRSIQAALLCNQTIPMWTRSSTTMILFARNIFRWYN